MNTSRLPRTILVVLLGALACSGTSEQTDSSTPAEHEHLVVVHMTDDMRFVPEQLEIAAGDTVVWVNDGAMPHTSTNKPGTAGVPEHNVLPDGAAPWDSGLLDPGETFRRVFTVPGDYAYLCFLHEAAGMVGGITVTD